MARMNWGRAAARDRVARYGGDRVEPDTYGRNKTPKKKSKGAKKGPQGEPSGSSNVCSADGGKCDWSPWERQSLGLKRRSCRKCGVVGYRKTDPSGSACPKSATGHEWSAWQAVGSGISKSVCLRCGRVTRRSKGKRKQVRASGPPRGDVSTPDLPKPPGRERPGLSASCLRSSVP